MPWVGFEPTIPASERAKTVHDLDRAAGHCDRPSGGQHTQINTKKRWTLCVLLAEGFSDTDFMLHCSILLQVTYFHVLFTVPNANLCSNLKIHVFSNFKIIFPITGAHNSCTRHVRGITQRYTRAATHGRIADGILRDCIHWRECSNFRSTWWWPCRSKHVAHQWCEKNNFKIKIKIPRILRF
jgi:hypothetical protein